MAKRILAIGLLTMVGDVTIAMCECCGGAYEHGIRPSKTVPTFCEECSTNRCDAYPGTCPVVNVYTPYDYRMDMTEINYETRVMSEGQYGPLTAKLV